MITKHPPTGQSALRTIIILLKEARRVRGLSFLEKTLLNEAKDGLRERCYTHEEVRKLLKRQAMRSYNAVSRMPAQADDAEIIKKLRNIKIIKF
jgi:hypothetical protein